MTGKLGPFDHRIGNQNMTIFPKRPLLLRKYLLPSHGSSVQRSYPVASLLYVTVFDSCRESYVCHDRLVN